MDTSQLNDLAISDRGFVFDPNSGHTCCVHAASQTMLRHRAAGTPVADRPGVLSKRFACDEPKDAPERDALGFVGMPKDAGLIR